MTNRKLGSIKLACRSIGMLVVMLVHFTSVSAQVATHFNKFQEFSEGRNLDSALYHAYALAGKNEAVLNQLMHNSFAQKFQKEQNKADTAFAFRLLRKLYTDSTSLPLKRATYPLYWYVATAKSLGDTAKTRQILTSFMKAQQRIGEGLDNRFDRYALLIYKQLRQQAVYANLADTLIRQTWNRLEHAVNGSYFLPIIEDERQINRAYYRYMMAAANALKADEARQQQDALTEERYRKGASDYSPDEFDQQMNSAYFYEAVFLFNDGEQTDFRRPYVDLILAKKDTARAIQLLTDMALADPGNLPLLKTYYAKAPVLNQPFNAYWRQVFNAKLKPAEPFRLTSLTNQVFDYAQYKGKWVLIDFWGTWCAPCVAELPEFQRFYDEITKSNRSDFVILTVACYDKGPEKVRQFVQENKYTFPVAMGDVPFIRQFRVSGFPIKVLITPEGKRMQIPSGTNWTERVRTYLANHE